MSVRSLPPLAVTRRAEETSGRKELSAGGVDTDDDIEKDWCFVSLYGTIENEYANEEDEEEEDLRQVTHNVANCISKELLYNQEDELQTETVDEIFRNFEEVAEVDPRPMITFLSAWRHQETLTNGKSSPTDKSIIIALMVDLLRVSPDPEKIHLLWLRILTHFILLSNSLQVLNDLKVAPTILGTMSAYRRSAEIQQYGCTALSIFATVRPTPTSKAPLRESAIQVLTESLLHHTDNIDVVQAACQLIATVAEVMVHIPSWCLEQEFTAEETEKLCQSADNILQCIKDGVIDRLGEISRRYEMTQEIQASITKLMACFGCYSSKKSYPPESDGFRPKAFSFPESVREKHVSFSKKLQIITLDNGESIPAVRCASLDMAVATQQAKMEMKRKMKRQETIDLEEAMSNHEESVVYDENHPLGDQDHPIGDEVHPSGDEEANQPEHRDDVEERDELLHVPHEECKHPPTDRTYLTDEERRYLIEEAWRFLDEAHSPQNNVSRDDDSSSGRMEGGEGEVDHIDGSPSEIEKGDLPTEEETKRAVEMDHETAHEHHWDCLFTSPHSDIEEDIDNNNDRDAVGHEGQYDSYRKDENSWEGTAQRGEEEEDEEQCWVDPNEDRDGRTIEDVVDEMSDGVYSYDVQPDNYTVYSEYDIMEALVKAGLLNEKEKEPGIPKFPVDDDLLEDGDVCTDVESDGGRTEDEVDRHPHSLNEGVVSEDSTSGNPESSSESERWNRVVSHYENVDGESHTGQGWPSSGLPQEETATPAADFKQASFDSGLEDVEGARLSSSGEEANGSNCEDNDHIHRIGRDQEMSEWGAFRRKAEDQRYIDECYRMSRLSIMVDDIQGLTWHENAAFLSVLGNAPQNSTIPETEPLLEGYVSGPQNLDDHEMENSTEGFDSALENSAIPERETYPEGEGYDSDNTLDRFLATERQRLDSQSSSQSCSSGSYCIQPYSRPMECRSLGSLDHLCSPRETKSVCELDVGKSRKRTDILKTMSCSNVDMVVPPPKPRRTWYYQSSWDVRRSLVRSFGPNYDGFDNPIYDEPPMDLLYATVSKPAKKTEGSEPTYAKVKKRHLSPSSSEASNSVVHKCGTASSNDSGVVLLVNNTYKSRSYSHLYEDVANLNINPKDKSDTSSRYLEEDSGEATYEVCTLWVNGKYVEALDTFNHLTQRLASPYSIVPEVRKEESRRSALLYDLEDLEDDYPAWASILNLLASDEARWTLRLTVRVLPIVDRLFQVKDKNVLNAVIELVQVLIRRYGKDIMKNKNPSLFRTRFREDCREGFMWLSKLKLRTEFLLMKRKEGESPDWDCLLHSSLLDSFSESLRPFNKSR